MAVLHINAFEKQVGNTVLFPDFRLTISENEVTAIYSSLNVRNVLTEMFLGEMSAVNREISINEIAVSKGDYTQIGISLLDEGLYERLTIKEHFTFYRRLYDSTIEMDEILRLTKLESDRNKKIKTLSPSKKKRVQFARVLFQNPIFYLFEEPDLNVEVETKRIFINLVEYLRGKGKSILLLTGNMESAITIANQVYRLDEEGLNLIDVEPEQAQEDSPPTDEIPKGEKAVQPIRFDKIPTKVNDKMVLFDPPEIDYIESNAGLSQIHIKGEAFPSVFTLTELEERLHPYGFFRCHRSYIVNMQRVREIITWTRNSYSLVLDDRDNSKIPLSKTKMTELKEMLGIK
ncbi:ATP-binding cassette domain-containing protein [Virgibacillus dakarensis]|nr:ATP-binding cassette domain-containing protein [Virgibacillus dakarensis]